MNQDITISFDFNPEEVDEGAELKDDHCDPDVKPRDIVTTLSRGWELPLGLDISVLPINKARLEGKKCVFHMRLNNVPWQMIKEIKEHMGLQDTEDMDVVNKKMKKTYVSGEPLCKSESKGPEACIQCWEG